jgi:hypothetical protein
VQRCRRPLQLRRGAELGQAMPRLAVLEWMSGTAHWLLFCQSRSPKRHEWKKTQPVE